MPYNPKILPLPKKKQSASLPERKSKLFQLGTFGTKENPNNKTISKTYRSLENLSSWTEPATISFSDHIGNIMASNGTRRARLCCNGSKYAAPMLHVLPLTYAGVIIYKGSATTENLCHDVWSRLKTISEFFFFIIFFTAYY